MPSGVHDSALIVNSFRARRSLLSGDPYAPLWITEESESWADQYAQQVGKTEILVHALRHRFFLNTLKQFILKNPDGVFINIGAGFTNYPYLISSETCCCEIDTEANIVFKQEKLADLERKGQIPQRQLDFFTVNNLNKSEEIDSLISILKNWVDGRASFILFEGVFFYLKLEAISYFFATLATLQKKGDQVACTSFRPEECHKLMFHRLIDYCQKGYRMMEFTPTTIPPSFYNQLSGYTLISHQNYYDLGEQFIVINELDNTNKVLEEDVYILEKLP